MLGSFGCYLSVLLLLCPCFAPAQDFRGALVGTVADSSGGRIAGADILLRSFSSGIERKAVTNDRGEFRFDDLSPGPYELIGKARGFADAQSTVTVVVASVRDIAVSLNPAAVQQSVNVHS